ncbi:MAG: 1,4-dihydroxy-6-naphthoate synthase [Desulfovibrionaceae bacterium]
MRILTLGYSTCPNDTYIFGPLASGLVRAGEYGFHITLADVERLNRWAAEGEPDVCKVSAAALPKLLERYWLLRAGGAVGWGVGPVLVAREAATPQDLQGRRVAIPGRNTTANLLFGLLLEELGVEVERVELVFDEIEPAVLSGDVAAGVLIHEGRFTYQRRGLRLVCDLGAWWEGSRGLPIPLGGIVMRRDLGEDAARAVNEAIRQSLITARGDESLVWPYVIRHAQELSQSVILEHIRTFVTPYSLDVGEEGESAVRALLGAAGRPEEPGATAPAPLFAPC